jgi:HD-GYP domain-containing protein (c-di-GMP phosphodiesterase class II)
MRLVSVDKLQPGALLARDIWTGTSGSIPLLRAGVYITPEYLSRLRRTGIAAIYVHDELSDGIEVPMLVREQTREKASQAIQRAFAELPQRAATGEAIPKAVLADLRSVVDRILDDLQAAGDAAVAFSDLATADAYTTQHSIQVTVLGLLLGRRVFNDYGWVDYRRQRSFEKIDVALGRLGLGLLLHDIGKLTIPTEILNKPGKLEPGEWTLMKSHPAAGEAMLQSDLISALAKGVVRSHHERHDGTGYPDGLARDEIPQFARIAAVADVYDAITSARPYRAAAPASLGVAEIVGAEGRHYDPQVVTAFRKVVAPYPVGSCVVLTDGRRGIVSELPDNHLDRPVVRLYAEADGSSMSPTEIALVNAPTISVKGLDESPPDSRAHAQAA